MRLLIAAFVLASCATTTPKKKSLGGDDIDVLWERQVPQAQEDNIVGQDTGPQKPAKLKSKASKKNRIKRTHLGPSFHTTNYYLTWQGKRIGEAKEVFHRSESGVRILRHEEIRIKRGGQPVDSETEVVIHADKNLRATRVELRARAGAITRKGSATRSKDGHWVIKLDGEPTRKVSRNAVPLELVPYLVAQDDDEEYRGTVLLAGYGFAVTEMKLDHDGQEGTALLKTRWGDIETKLKMAGDGSLLRASTGPTGSVRVGANELKEQFARPELPGLSSIPLSGEGDVLLVNNALRQPPPAVAGQSVSLRKKGWRIQFDKEPAKVSRRLAALVRQVDSLLKDSHDAPGAGAEDAMALGRGDCTAHSTLLVDLAIEQGMQAKLVTGFRIEGNELVRHRWVTVKQGKSWVQVDPTFGEAPVAPGKHLALAVHGDSTAQIALVDEAVFRGLSKASAQWTHSRVARR
jgi:hypothetical protein